MTDKFMEEFLKLSKENKKLKKDIESLEADKSRLIKDKNKLKNANANLRKEVNVQRKENTRVSRNIQVIKQKNSKYENNFKTAVAIAIRKKNNEVNETYTMLRKVQKKQRESNDIIAELKETIEIFKSTLKDYEKKIKRLENKLNKDSVNSGIPTSRTAINKTKRIPNSRVKSNKSIGGQFGHKKESLETLAPKDITSTIEHEHSSTCSCGGNLNHIRTIYKDVIDIEFVVSKIRNVYTVCKCDKCGSVVKPNIPKELHADCSYGENIKALSLLLLNDTNVPYNKIKKLINGITGGAVNISEGYIAKVQKNSSNALMPFIEQLKSVIVNQRILHWDDTVIPVNKKRACFRFYGNNNYALYTSHMKKDLVGMEEDGIFSNLTSDTILLHDHLSSNYRSEFKHINAECNEHLKRDLNKVIAETNHSWATDMLNLLLAAKDNETVSDEYIKIFDDKYDLILSKGINEYKYETKNYYDFEYVLIRRLCKFKENYTLFVRDLDVPFTNNLAERSLRMCKTKMKVSGQFQNINTAKDYAVNRSYIETSIRHGINPFEAIKQLVSGKFISIEEMKKMCTN